MEKVIITQKHVDNKMIEFKDVTLKTSLTTGFDGDVDKDDKVNINLAFNLNGDGELVDYIFDRAVAALRIKVNTPGDVLKGNAVDHETYVEFLEDNERSFEFDVKELMEFKSTSELHKGMKAVDKMDAEELENFKQYLNSL